VAVIVLLAVQVALTGLLLMETRAVREQACYIEWRLGSLQDTVEGRTYSMPRSAGC
jgi:hypothetical protein